MKPLALLRLRSTHQFHLYNMCSFCGLAKTVTPYCCSSWPVHSTEATENWTKLWSVNHLSTSYIISSSPFFEKKKGGSLSSASVGDSELYSKHQNVLFIKLYFMMVVVSGHSLEI